MEHVQNRKEQTGDADRLEEGVIDTRDETQKISHVGTNTRTTMRSRKQQWCLGKPQNCLVWLEAKPRGRAGDTLQRLVAAGSLKDSKT